MLARSASSLGIVSILTVIAVAWMLVHFARSGSRHVLFPVALGLLVGGSLSNLIDRVAHGHVTDFIDVSHWPTFNLADTFIVIGVALDISRFTPSGMAEFREVSSSQGTRAIISEIIQR